MKRDELNNIMNAMTKEELDNLYAYLLSTPSKEWANKETCPYQFSRSYASIFLEKKGYAIKHNNKNIENNVNQRLIKGVDNVSTNDKQCVDNVSTMCGHIKKNVSPMCEQFVDNVLAMCQESVEMKQVSFYLSQVTKDKLQELCDQYPMIQNKCVIESLIRTALENIKGEK